MKTTSIRLMAFLIALISASATGAADENDSRLLFSYFKGNGEDGLHLAASDDGLTWEALNYDMPFLAPAIGNEKLMRDPCIITGPDGMFHMVWTVSWNDRVIGYARSKDLIEWSEQIEIPVMMHEPGARNCWAPELFYDSAAGDYVIFWSTTIPGRFPETEASSETDYNHRIYCTTTRDFESFTPTRLFYDPGFNCIDGTIVRAGDRFVMFFKDETLKPPQKNIRMAYASSPKGPWGNATKPITGDYWAEGPTATHIDGRWIVYFDKYRKHAFGAVQSTDLSRWDDVSGTISFPDGVRHGTVFTAPQVLLDSLQVRTRTAGLDAYLASLPVTQRETVYKSAGGADLKLHIFEPSERPSDKPLPAIVFFFGGGWTGGTPSQFFQHSRYLASRGMVAVSAEYRVKNRHGTTPAECVADGKSAVRWLRSHAAELGIDPARIAAGGGSAGGHVALCTAVIEDTKSTARIRVSVPVRTLSYSSTPCPTRRRKDGLTVSENTRNLSRRIIMSGAASRPRSSSTVSRTQPCPSNMSGHSLG